MIEEFAIKINFQLLGKKLVTLTTKEGTYGNISEKRINK